jgi:hypothetical protein
MTESNLPAGDFSSEMTLQARRYEVHVDQAQAAQAVRYVL